MEDSPQNIYAKYLPNSRGYPLWFPEPSSTLPLSYEQDGLQIGDVGFVDPKGWFNVLFNVSLSLGHALHQPNRRLLTEFQFEPTGINIDTEVNFKSNADPPGTVILSPSITRVDPQVQESSECRYEFIPTSTTGAILILPDGATCHDLKSKDGFRKLAMECAFDWYGIATELYGEEDINGCSLYLITGFYKARSWSMASYHDPTSTETNDRRIRISIFKGDRGGNSTRYSSFPVEFRDRPGDHGGTNQTIYISGFKIAVREDVLRWTSPKPVVEPVPAMPRRRQGCRLANFLKKRFAKKPPRRRKVDARTTVDHEPELRPPFHPSDTINRFLLDHNPEALVAVTHDSQWMAMIENGEVTPQDLTQDKQFEQFLTENYHSTFQSENIIDTHCKLADDTWQQYPTATDGSQVVITRIRAENVATGLKRMPIGFCILVEFDSIRRATKNKSVRVFDSVIEWDDVIVLPQTTSKVQLSVCASFELSQMLGRGEILHSLERSISEWEKDTPLIQFSSMGGGNKLSSSLLITVERRGLNPVESASYKNSTNLNTSELAEQTNSGHDFLLRFYDEPFQENIDNAIQCFERALNMCPANHPSRFAVLRNLARAYLFDYRINNTGTKLEEAILLYRRSLEGCTDGHQDQPATLVYLAQALGYRYESQGCEESVRDEVNELVARVQSVCLEDSHEYRAVALVPQTCKRCFAVSNPGYVGFEELISELDLAIQESPYDSFDKPERLYNLGAMLLKQYELRGDLAKLDRSIGVHEEALGLTSVGHPDRTKILAGLCVSLARRFERVRDLADFDKCISIGEPALQRFAHTHADRAKMLVSLGMSFLWRFEQSNDLADLDKSIAMFKERLLQLRSTDQPDDPETLVTLGREYLWRFARTDGPEDLDTAISMFQAASGELSESHPDRPRMLADLGEALLKRFECMGHLPDLEASMVVHKEAARLVGAGQPSIERDTFSFDGTRDLLKRTLDDC